MWCHKQYYIKCVTFITLIKSTPCWQVYSRDWSLKSGGWRSGHRVEKAHGRQPNDDNNNNTGATGQSGPGRDHKMVHPTMWASFLATNEGSSISEVEAAGIVSSRGSKPLLSIKLETRPEDYVTMLLNIHCTCVVTDARLTRKRSWGVFTDGEQRKMFLDPDEWDMEWTLRGVKSLYVMGTSLLTLGAWGHITSRSSWL